MAALRQRNIVQVAEIDLTNTASTEPSATFTPPSFTVKDLLSAIPRHCFERSALRSTAYLLGDILMAASLFWAASYIDPSFGENGAVLNGVAGSIAKWAAWATYWVVNGFVLTGIWVLAHECGHQAFSTSKAYNNFVGLILHSFLLVPYHSWRISHARHHAATGHMTRDEVFVPRTRSARVGDRKPRKIERHGIEMEELLEDAPLFRLSMLIFQQLFGWPAYLIANASGQPLFPAFTNHFSPYSPIFDVRHRPQIVLSDAALIVMGYLLHLFRQQVGWSGLVKYYIVPYLMVNHWLVMITYLQHTDPNLPHYRAAEWTFARGALCTVDRTLMGPLGAIFFHGICETHVSHHISSKIPHYNAWEATEALEKFLGEHYHKTDENMFVSLWKNYRLCRFVEDEGDVVFYKDANGRSAVTVKHDSATDSGVDVSGDDEVLADC